MLFIYVTSIGSKLYVGRPFANSVSVLFETLNGCMYNTYLSLIMTITS